MTNSLSEIEISGAAEHNLKNVDLKIERNKITVITGVSGSGKSSLAFDTLLAESQRRFFYTLSNYTRQFLDLGSRPNVKKVTGLSPAISLAQNETQPSRKATVATLSEIGELLGIVFARFSEKRCPKHDLPTESQSLESIHEKILKDYKGKTIALCAPIVEQKKGNFRTRLGKYAQRGFVRAYIDGQIVSLSPVPELVKEEKHTIKLVIDHVKVSEKSLKRLSRSLNTAFEEAESHIEIFDTEKDGSIVEDSVRTFSLKSGCPTCGFAWPTLDTRYFSVNSLGQCPDCEGYGVEQVYEDEEDDDRTALEKALSKCETCDGTGLKEDLASICVDGDTIHKAHSVSISDLRKMVHKWRNSKSLKDNPAFLRVYTEIDSHLERLEVVGLGYLQLSRRIRSLSGGEAQRLKLAGILGENLRGVMYILDEPSQGLHPSEIETLCETLRSLCDYGNTIVIVDHDDIVMKHADVIVDLGPEGGAQGGKIMAKFPPKSAKSFAKLSSTAKFLSGSEHEQVLARKIPKASDYIEIKKPRLNNLQLDAVKFPKGQFSVVTGVSGSGKSSLVLTLLYENAAAAIAAKKKKKKAPKAQFVSSLAGIESFDNIWLIDRKPVAKSTVSMPASYLDIFTDLRKLYESVPEAQIAGLTARSFSLQLEGGRCEECRGRGEVTLSMRFLSDARVKCPSCDGLRYQGAILGVTYKGLNIAEVLRLSIDEAIEHFSTHRKILKRLKPAQKLGLGYLKLGQQSASLSGGEAQRLKLVPFLTKTHGEGTLLVVDEPTTGLHHSDTKKLIAALRELVEMGTTVILIEHNMDVVAQGDWVVDLGPGAAEQGGKVVFQGLPKDLKKHKSSVTARFLQ